jgi:alginate O-acetyltransferase complex protein AlgI
LLFNSIPFLALVGCTFAFYYVPPLSQVQVPILIGASIIFYAWSQPMLLLLLFTCLLINVVTSHLVIVGDKSWRRVYAALGVGFNILVLVLYKYGPLIVHTLPFDAGSIGAVIVALPLPLGISFFTFHGITLLVDTLHARSGAGPQEMKKHSLLLHTSKIGLYFLFFPQLVSGPITKSRNFLPQVGAKRLRDIQWEYVFRNVTLGYFLKMVIADNLAQQTFWISFPYFLSRPTSELLIMLWGYSMQIFADFAGYTLIAIGIAALFGYMLPQNFNSPYLANSFSEFWQRWHISLASFLKEYLYIPLGGNRGGRVRTYFNLFVVMLLGGIWHGAAWSYMVWGGAHGVALAGERMLRDRVHLPNTSAIQVIRISLVFCYVTGAWLLFKLPDFSNVVEYVRAIWQNTEMNGSADIRWFIAIYSFPVVAYHIIRACRPRFSIIDRPYAAALLYGLMIFLIVTNSGVPQAFVYFQF